MALLSPKLPHFMVEVEICISYLDTPYLANSHPDKQIMMHVFDIIAVLYLLTQYMQWTEYTRALVNCARSMQMAFSVRFQINLQRTVLASKALHSHGPLLLGQNPIQNC